LTQPQSSPLATLLDDTPVDMVQPNGTHWTPQNDDHEAHGRVALIEALAHSYNLATVHLGLAIGVEVRGLLGSFGLRRSTRIRHCRSARSTLAARSRPAVPVLCRRLPCRCALARRHRRAGRPLTHYGQPAPASTSSPRAW
jgi:hypothetical protein